MYRNCVWTGDFTMYRNCVWTGDFTMYRDCLDRRLHNFKRLSGQETSQCKETIQYYQNTIKPW